MGDGLSDVNVVEGFDGVIEGESHVGAIGFGQDPRSVDGLKLRHLVGGQLGCDVDLAASVGEEASVLIREEVEFDGLCGSVPSPPGAALFEDCTRVGLEGDGLVGARSHDEVRGGPVGGGGFVEGFLGDPQASVRGDRPPEVDGGSGKRHGDLVVAAALGPRARRPVGGRGG